MQNFKEIGPAVCSGEYPGMKNGGASYNMSQPVFILLGSKTKSNQNWIKKHRSKKYSPVSFVKSVGLVKNSRSHLKLILCCSLPNVIPHIKFHLNRMKNTEVQIFEFFDPSNFFEKSAKAKLSKLEPFSWSHWIRNYETYLYC